MEKTYPPEPVWSMLGTGHFWKREVWEAVSARELRAGWYLELDFATSVVDLGFRLAGLPDQDPNVQALPENLACGPEEARKQGAWTLHPVKVPLDQGPDEPWFGRAAGTVRENGPLYTTGERWDADASL